MVLFKPSHPPLGRKRNTKHDCEQVVLQTYAAREDLRETPLESPDLTLFMMEAPSCNMGREGWVCCGHPHHTLETAPLSPGTSAQLAELTALTRALELGEGKGVNIS